MPRRFSRSCNRSRLKYRPAAKAANTHIAAGADVLTSTAQMVAALSVWPRRQNSIIILLILIDFVLVSVE